MAKTRGESDTLGEVQVPADRLLGRPDPAVARELQDRRRAHAGRGRSAPWRWSRRRPPWPTSSWPSSTRSWRDAIAAAADRGHRRQARRPLPAGGLADRQRHPDQHERQRGDRQPRHRAAWAARSAKKPVHPNDHVNMSQSSNDTFPTAMHIAAVGGDRGAPAAAHADAGRGARGQGRAWDDIVKIGRTHLMDATPLTLGQEVGGCAAQVEQRDRAASRPPCPHLRQLADRRHRGRHRAQRPGRLRRAHRGRARRAHRPPLRHRRPTNSRRWPPTTRWCHAPARSRPPRPRLMKIANDVRWLGSGPRCGIGELILPANEPGSSIMPGKVNPTQCEALTMVARR